jgi:hypothetical protein
MTLDDRVKKIERRLAIEGHELAQIPRIIAAELQEALNEDRASRCADDDYKGWYERGKAECANTHDEMIQKAKEEARVTGCIACHGARISVPMMNSMLCSYCYHVARARHKAYEDAAKICGESCAWTAQKAILAKINQ